MTDLLYEGIEDDDQLRPLFPRDLAGSRAMQKLFFAEWLGGPRRYSEQAHAGLSHTHDGLPITPALADRWLAHFGRALAATAATTGDRSAILAQVRSLAMALVSWYAYERHFLALKRFFPASAPLARMVPETWETELGEVAGQP